MPIFYSFVIAFMITLIKKTPCLGVSRWPRVGALFPMARSWRYLQVTGSNPLRVIIDFKFYVAYSTLQYIFPYCTSMNAKQYMCGFIFPAKSKTYTKISRLTTDWCDSVVRQCGVCGGAGGAVTFICNYPDLYSIEVHVNSICRRHTPG